MVAVYVGIRKFDFDRRRIRIGARMYMSRLGKCCAKNSRVERVRVLYIAVEIEDFRIDNEIFLN